MRRRYKEHSTMSKNSYLTVQIYPEFASFTKSGKRRSNYKPTSDRQKEINERNKKLHLIHTCNENFTENDFKVELTYSNENLPDTIEQAQRDFVNFIRRYNRLRKKKGLSPAKYFQVLECGKVNGRFHHHCIISGDLDYKEIRDCWGKGITRATLLEFNEQTGIQGLVEYMLKLPIVSNNSKSYKISRNMKKIEPQNYSSRLWNKDLKNMITYTDFNVLERLYPEFKLCGEPKVLHSDETENFYIHVQMYKPLQQRKRGKHYDERILPGEEMQLQKTC